MNMASLAWSATALCSVRHHWTLGGDNQGRVAKRRLRVRSALVPRGPAGCWRRSHQTLALHKRFKGDTGVALCDRNANVPAPIRVWMKCMCQRGRAASHALTLGCLSAAADAAEAPLRKGGLRLRDTAVSVRVLS